MTSRQWIVHVGWFNSYGFFFKQTLKVSAQNEMEARRQAYRLHRDPRAPIRAYEKAEVTPATEAPDA
jgi:hypothetical protein